jgi:hypothetical protein
MLPRSSPRSSRSATRNPSERGNKAAQLPPHTRDAGSSSRSVSIHAYR